MKKKFYFGLSVLITLALILFLAASGTACFNCLAETIFTNDINVEYERVDFYHKIEIDIAGGIGVGDSIVECNSENNFCEGKVKFKVLKREKTAVFIIRDEAENVLLEEEVELSWANPRYKEEKCGDARVLVKSANVTLPDFDPDSEDETSAP